MTTTTDTPTLTGSDIAILMTARKILMQLAEDVLHQDTRASGMVCARAKTAEWAIFDVLNAAGWWGGMTEVLEALAANLTADEPTPEPQSLRA